MNNYPVNSEMQKFDKIGNKNLFEVDLDKALSIAKVTTTNFKGRNVRVIGKAVRTFEKVVHKIKKAISEFQAKFHYGISRSELKQALRGQMQQSIAISSRTARHIENYCDYDKTLFAIQEKEKSNKNVLNISIKKRAEEFVKLTFNEEPTGEILNYINNVLDDPSFQADPQEFLKQWQVKRGFTEEFRYPEDRARRFFDLREPIFSP